MSARGERRRRDDGRVGREGDCEPLTEQKERDERVAVVCYESDEMCPHAREAGSFGAKLNAGCRARDPQRRRGTP